MDKEDYVKEIEKFDKRLELQTQVPSYVIHYTTVSNLYKIIDNGTLRFSLCDSSNDFDEGFWIYKVLDSVLSNLRNKNLKENLIEYFSLYDLIRDIDSDTDHIREFDGDYDKLIDFLKEYGIEHSSKCIETLNYHKKQSNKKYFQLCFSSEDDITSMWKYYAKSEDSPGCNITFEMEEFQSDITYNLYNEFNADSRWFKCIYDIEEQERILKDKLNLLSKIWTKSKVEFKKLLLDEFADFIEEYKYIFKHPDFKDEFEIKCIAIISNNNYERLLREGKLILDNKKNGTFFLVKFHRDEFFGKPTIKYHIYNIKLSRTISYYSKYINEINKRLESNNYTRYDITKSKSPLKY